MRRWIAAILLIGPLASGAVCAESDPDTPAAEAGRRVRVRWSRADGSTSVFTGRLLDLTAERAVVQSDGGPVVVVPGPTILGLDVGRSRPGRWKRVLAGAAIGVGIGAVVGLASGDDTACSFVCFTGLQKGMLLGMVLAPVGALGGAASASDEWRPVPLPISTRAGHPGIRFAVSRRW